MAANQNEGELELDLSSELGSEPAVSSQCISIYIPNKDKSGREIGDQRKWVLEAIQLLSEINGGATAMPPVEGAWMNDDTQLIWEHPVVVYSFIVFDRFVSSLPRLREFLHRLGRETKQGEIAFEFDGQFHRIRRFDARRKKG
jgi:hypothetical protein